MAGLVDSVKWMRTGLYRFDQMTGGGIPIGRTTMLYGDEGIGKTTFAFELIKVFQKKGRILWLDYEESLDLKYMWAVGVDRKKCDIVEPEYMEQGLQRALDVGRKNRPHYSLVVMDSLAEMTPKKELEGDIDDSHVGLVSRKMGQFLRMSGKLFKDNDVTSLIINQSRERIGGFGGGITTTGGRAVKHKAALMIFCTGSDSKTYPGGKILRLWQKKNKVSANIRGNCEYEIERGKGIVRELEYVEIALEIGLMTKKKGGNYYIGDTHIQGRVNAGAALARSERFQKFLRTGEL